MIKSLDENEIKQIGKQGGLEEEGLSDFVDYALCRERGSDEYEAEWMKKFLNFGKEECEVCGDAIATHIKHDFFLCKDHYLHYCQYDEGGGMNEPLHLWRLLLFEQTENNRLNKIVTELQVENQRLRQKAIDPHEEENKLKNKIVGKQLDVFGNESDVFETGQMTKFRIIRYETRCEETEYIIEIDTEDSKFMSELESEYGGSISDYIERNFDSLSDGFYEVLNYKCIDDDLCSISEWRAQGWTQICSYCADDMVDR